MKAPGYRSRKEAPVKVKEGDEVKSHFDGEEFMITRITNSIVVLKSIRGQREILTGIDSLGMFYSRKITPVFSEKNSGEFYRNPSDGDDPPTGRAMKQRR